MKTKRHLPPASPVEERFPVVTSLSDKAVERYRGRVAKGAALLDEKRPGWWRKIRLTSLAMDSGDFYWDIHDGVWVCGCVGAQVAYHYAPTIASRRKGWYHEGMRLLGLWNVDARREVAHGFLAGSPESHGAAEEVEAYHLLDALWANEVRARREAHR